MPILKPISGHTNVQGIKRYLEKEGRAIARDFFNLSWDERFVGDQGEEEKANVEWADQMDATREAAGNHLPWKGRQARTFKHFVLSPDPQDRIDLGALRELACAWALKNFPDFEIAIVYHDDNENRIPHAHIVVNNTNLSDARRLHTEHPEDLNRDLQEMARKRGLRSLSNERKRSTGLEELAASKETERVPPRSRQAVYLGRAEREIAEAGGWSWVADIRSRVTIAKTLAKSEGEFRSLLQAMEIDISDNSAKARRDDWIFSLADEPTKKVSGGRLGMSFSKEQLQRRFARKESYRPTTTSASVIRARAEAAVELNDLVDLDKLAHALDTCSRFGIVSLEDFDRRLGSRVLKTESRIELMLAREYMAEKKMLPARIENSARPRKAQPAAEPQSARSAAMQRQRILQQEQQRQRKRER